MAAQTIRLTAMGGDGEARRRGGDDAPEALTVPRPKREAKAVRRADLVDATVDGGSASTMFTFESISIVDSTPLSTASGTLAVSNGVTVDIVFAALRRRRRGGRPSTATPRRRRRSRSSSIPRLLTYLTQ